MKPADASAPEEFGPYVVYERLGVGGMATVHRAKKRGIAGFERGVALKRMLPHLADDAEFINSFVREAKLASLLVHPNIAQIYDFGRVGNVYYIAMEHVDGFDVRKMLRYSNRHKEPLPLNVVMSIMCELCDALEYAHTFVDEHGQPQGIVHRDVSPSNLIIAQSGHLKVIDFGIAKANVRQLHTESGRVKGKLGYMSPEAVSGRAFGPVSDVFSAGVVAHELLTAHPLFSAKTDYDTLIRIHEAEIPPPSRRNAGVPATLDEVVLAALSRDPERRLQTAGAFREALEYVADQSGIRFSARDVAEWRAKIATTEDPWGSRTSLPNVSSAAVSRAFPFPESRSAPSGTNQRPLPESGGSQPLPSQEPRPARPVTSVGEPSPDDDKGVADLTWGADALQAPMHRAVPEPGHAAAPPQKAMPAGAPAMQPRRGLAARLALVVLFMIAAGLAVYQFVLRPKKPAPAPPPPPALATLKFVVQPADAIIEIGGKKVSESSPFDTQLAPGVYTVAVHRPGYKRFSTDVKLPDQQLVQVALEPGVAHVSVTSQPPGLVAQLDGKQLDQVTPLELDTSVGPHQLVVTNAAGTTWPQDFTAEMDKKYSFNATFPPVKKGAASAAASSARAAAERATDRAAERAADRATERVTERAPDRSERPADRATERPTDRAADRATDRATDRAPDRPARRTGNAASARSAEAEPVPAKEAEPPPPPKPDAGVPAVVAEPSRTTPVGPATPKSPPVVAVNTVTKLSGEAPVIKANVTEPFADVTGKMCIGLDGRVTSVKMYKALPEIVDELQHALMGWRYRPYVNSTGQASPACFALNLRVVFKRSN